MSVELVFDRLRSANPVPDPTALREETIDTGVFLAATEQRREKMQTTTVRPTEGRTPKRLPALALASVLLAVVAALGIVTLVRNDTSAAFERRVEIIEEQAAAYSSGDMEAWVSYYAENAPIYNGNFLVGPRMTSTQTWFRSFMVANDQWTITGDCEEAGSDAVTCPMLRRDDFHGAGGLEAEGSITFTFDEDDRITSFSMSPAPERVLQAQYTPFDQAFDAWLEQAYPEVHAGFGVPVFTIQPNADDMPTALEYVDEFVAQSDEYPRP